MISVEGLKVEFGVKPLFHDVSFVINDRDRIAAPVALVVCLTLICTILLSQLIGGILPVAAEKLHVDPAVMASPLITTIVDTTTLLVYFNIAKALLHL